MNLLLVPMVFAIWFLSQPPWPVHPATLIWGDRRRQARSVTAPSKPGCLENPRPRRRLPTSGLNHPGLASFLFAVALVRADDPSLLTAVLPVAPAILAPVHPIGLGDGERPSVDASSITLTVSAFVEMDTPTTRLKMMMDDLETNAGVMFWSSFGHVLMTFSQNTSIWNGSFLASSAADNPSRSSKSAGGQGPSDV